VFIGFIVQSFLPARASKITLLTFTGLLVFPFLPFFLPLLVTYTLFFIFLYLVGQKHYRLAVHFIKAALILYPFDATAHSHLALTYYLLGRHNAAFTVAHRAVAIGPNNATNYRILGNLYLFQERYGEALTALQTSVSVKPESPGYQSLGCVYFALEQYDEAIFAFKNAIDLKDEVLLLLALASTYRVIGNQDAYERYIKMSRERMTDKENEYTRACLESASGNTDEAISLIQVALEKKQVMVNWLQYNPSISFVRNDPRFREIIAAR
jgi:tetratricopeptide (TPR) repeat protein